MMRQNIILFLLNLNVWIISSKMLPRWRGRWCRNMLQSRRHQPFPGVDLLWEFLQNSIEECIFVKMCMTFLWKCDVLAGVLRVGERALIAGVFGREGVMGRWRAVGVLGWSPLFRKSAGFTIKTLFVLKWMLIMIVMVWVQNMEFRAFLLLYLSIVRES